MEVDIWKSFRERGSKAPSEIVAIGFSSKINVSKFLNPLKAPFGIVLIKFDERSSFFNVINEVFCKTVPSSTQTARSFPETFLKRFAWIKS